MPLDPQDRAELAAALGMKPTEIVGAADLAGDRDALVVQTIDGQHVTVRPPEREGGPLRVAPYDEPVSGQDAEDQLDVDDELDVDDAVGEGGDPGATEVVDVPDGNVDEVLAWVADDPVRARAALEVEQAGRKRATLLANLNRMLEQQ